MPCKAQSSLFQVQRIKKMSLANRKVDGMPTFSMKRFLYAVCIISRTAPFDQGANTKKREGIKQPAVSGNTSQTFSPGKFRLPFIVSTGIVYPYLAKDT